MKLLESLTYEPHELAFGTSGLRGLVADMTDLECYINVSGFVKFLAHRLEPGAEIFVAGDLRDSTPRIVAAVSQAIRDKGYKPVYCGLIPTPAVALYAQDQNAACIMVTGSHIPADRNGIKFYKPSGEVLKSDESDIQVAVSDVRQRIYSTEQANFNPDGSLSSALTPLREIPEAASSYIDRYTQIPNKPLAGKHVVVYQHSAVGRDMLVKILASLGATTTAVGRSDAFVPIDTENVTPEDKAYFINLAKEYPDNFAIVSTDGDSDRPFVIDETGTFYRGDVLGCLVAQALGANFAATPISSNDAVDEFLKSKNVESVHTKIGSPYVIEAMNTSSAIVKVGWEVNGGFLLGSDVNYQGISLTSLPTRDAVLPILVALIEAAKSRQKVSEFFAQLPERYTGGGLIDVSQAATEAFRALTKDQAKSESLVAGEIDDPKLGTSQSVDLTDGIRIKFSSGDIIHIRPSGNAPQLRIYTNCNTQDRADDLAMSATSKGGLLERFISAAEK